jgi:hypothetical protein
MLIIDDLLLFPFRRLLWICQEIHKAAQQGLVDEADAITLELSELYMMLETDRISEDEFDAREKELLDRLDTLRDRAGPDEKDPRDETADHELP